MKRLLLSCLLIFTIFQLIAAQDSVSAMNSDSIKIAGNSSISENKVSVSGEAIAAYNDGNFRKVIEILEVEKKAKLTEGVESSELYYNLGNAYFRVNDLAEARLNYEKALLLNPGDRDTRHNIEYLKTKIEDKILVADKFFLTTWFNGVQNTMSSNAWSIVAVSLFIMLIACLSAFFFSRSVLLKKIAFYVGIVSVVIVTFANVFAFRQKKKIEFRDTAVIITGSASIMGSPDINSKELFILHAGTKVYITKEDRSWLEIEIDNGSVGWVQRDKIEVI